MRLVHAGTQPGRVAKRPLRRGMPLQHALRLPQGEPAFDIVGAERKQRFEPGHRIGEPAQADQRVRAIESL